MADENKPQTEPKADDAVGKAEEKPKAETPDPYADLTPDERAAAQSLDEAWAKSSHKERLRMHELALEKARELSEKRSKPADDKPKAAVEDDGDEDRPVTRAEFKKLERELAARDQREKDERDRKEFFTLVDEAIAANPDLKETPKLRKLVRSAAVGEAVTTRPADVKAMVRRLAEEAVEDLRSQRETYVAGKDKSRRETAGETRGGGVPPTEKPEVKPTDLEDGTLKARARAMFSDN